MNTSPTPDENASAFDPTKGPDASAPQSYHVDWVVVVNEIPGEASDSTRLRLQLQGNYRTSLLEDIFRNLVFHEVKLLFLQMKRIPEHPTFYDLRLSAKGTSERIAALHEYFLLRPTVRQTGEISEKLPSSALVADIPKVNVTASVENVLAHLLHLFRFLQSSAKLTTSHEPLVQGSAGSCGDLGSIVSMSFLSTELSGSPSTFKAELSAASEEARRTLEEHFEQQRLRRLSHEESRARQKGRDHRSS